MKATAAVRRRRWFRVVLLTPLVLVCLVLLAALVRFLQIASLDATALLETQRAALLEPRVPSTQASVRDGVPGVERDGRWIRLDRQGASRLVHVLGGSSTVLPSDATAFPGQLQAALDPQRTRVANLGHVGFTAAAIASRAGSALALGRPDVVVVYEGHNDTTAVFRNSLQEAYGFFEHNVVLRGAVAPVLVAGLAYRWRDLPRALERWPWVMQLELQPHVTRALGDAGFIRADADAVRAADEIARDLFVSGLREVMASARSVGATVVLVTPISNLEVEPVGLGPAAHEAWAAGLAATTRPERLRLLRAARDLDAFNGQLRAKSSLVEAIRTLDDGRAVRVFDLERTLEADPTFAFGQADFVDEVHLTRGTHARVATLLEAFLRAGGLLDPPSP